MKPVTIQLQMIAGLFFLSVSAIAFNSLTDNINKFDESDYNNVNQTSLQTSEIKKDCVTRIDVKKYQTSVVKIKYQKTVAKAKTQPPKRVAKKVSKKLYGATGRTVVKEDIIKHSVDMNVDPAIALSIAKIESNFDHNKRSVHGAVGVFQILPATAKSMGYDAYSQKGNIKSGITYYKRMYQKFGNVDLALAAYNAGPGSVRRYGGVPPFAETKRFIYKIKNEYQNQKNNPLIAKYQNQQM